MSYRLVPKSVTLNDLGGVMALFCVISPNTVVFRGAHCVKVVKDTSIHPPSEI